MIEQATHGGEAGTSGDQAVRLEFTSETTHLSAVRELVSAAARKVGLPENEVNNVALAIDEAVTNIIKHGYGNEAGRPIVIEVAPTMLEGRPALELLLLDRGRQVEPEQIVGRDLCDIRPGGLGTHIIRSMTDVAEYSRREGGGMRLRLIKSVRPTGHDSIVSSQRGQGDAG